MGKCIQLFSIELFPLVVFDFLQQNREPNREHPQKKMQHPIASSNVTIPPIIIIINVVLLFSKSNKNVADLLFFSSCSIVESFSISSLKFLPSLLGSNLATSLFVRVEIPMRVLPATTIATAMIVL